MLIKIIGYSISSIIGLYISSVILEKFIVFGNVIIGYAHAIILTGFAIGFISTLVKPITEEYKIKLNQTQNVLLNLCVNIITLYILARTPLSKSFGIGIVSFWVAIAAGCIVYVCQYYAAKLLNEKGIKV